jgi:type II secretory pathway component PulM
MALSEQMNSWTEKLKEQEWYQQVQSSYQQLSPEQQQYVRWGTFGTLSVVFLYFTLSIFSSANSMKSEYFEKQELLQLVNQAGDEIRRLKGQNAGIGNGGAQTWKAVVEGWATTQGLSADSAEIIKESPGVSQNIIQESLLEVQVKGIGLRPLVQMLFQVEHGTPPVKLKGLQVENGTDGLLNVKMNLSGFMPKAEKK